MKEKYQGILEQIDESYRVMKAMRPLPKAGVQYFVEEMGISIAHNSNALEGNTFTFDETRLLLEKGITASARSFREHEEIVGYKQGFDFLYRALKEERVVDEDFIKTLHAYVLRGSEGAGEYRTIQNYVGSLTKVKYTPCPPSQVPGKMRDYVAGLQEGISENKQIREQENVDWERLFHALAAHHIEFEKIHPFVDGNGRTGRLLLTYEMISLGLLPVDIRYEERERYYAGLASYDVKAKRSTRPESKTEKMAGLIAECELRSMKIWNDIFADYQGERKNDLAGSATVGTPAPASPAPFSAALSEAVANMPTQPGSASTLGRHTASGNENSNE